MEMLRRNGLAVAGTFFQKKKSHKITNKGGWHKTELDLLVVRQHQLGRAKDCKALPGEYVITQHKPVVFDVRLKKWKMTMGSKNIKWWKCKDYIMVEYRKKQKPRMVDRRGGEGSGGEAGNMEDGHLYGQTKKADRRAEDRVRRSIEEEL